MMNIFSELAIRDQRSNSEYYTCTERQRIEKDQGSVSERSGWNRRSRWVGDQRLKIRDQRSLRVLQLLLVEVEQQLGRLRAHLRGRKNNNSSYQKHLLFFPTVFHPSNQI